MAKVYFFRYYFNQAYKKSNVNPFLKIGFEYLSYKSTFRYTENQEIIFGKGDENQANLSTGMFLIGAGCKTSLSKHFYLITSLDFNIVKYDFLDVVHNYDNEGNRVNVTGLYSALRIGIYYNTAKSDIIVKSKKRKGMKSKDLNNLPFGR